MGGLNVKNTMIQRVLEIIAPHPCSGCGKIGPILCEDCKYDIIHEPFLGCILCGRPNSDGICTFHHSPVVRAFTAGARTGTLEIILNKLKFQHVKAAAEPLAELLHTYLPILPKDITIVPIPTVSSHVRQRGYDQTDLISAHLSNLRGLKREKLLTRISTATQHIVGRVERKQQADNAFALRTQQDLTGRTILLVDDIVTTGATLTAAAELLKKAGATVWVATLAYQPLD